MEFYNYTVKFLIDDYIAQVMSLSEDRLTYSECKKIVLNALADDDCAAVVSAYYHKHMDDTYGRGVTSDSPSSPTVTEGSKGSTP